MGSMGAGTNLFAILDRITPSPGLGSSDVIQGPFSSALWETQFCSVNFSYDSRKDHAVLHQLNLIIPKGRTLALVGMRKEGSVILINLTGLIILGLFCC